MSTDVKKEKVKVSVAQIQGMLDAGIDRDEIGVKLGLNKANVTRMFKHPDLKGHKVKRARSGALNAFEFVDETATDTASGSDNKATQEEETKQETLAEAKGW